MSLSLKTFRRMYHDVEYTIELHIEEERLVVSAEEVESGEMWKGEFTARYLEELTTKTGNAKKFGVFEKMLAKGLEGGSSSVIADVLSAQELENYRSKKPGKSGILTSRVGNKRYLILTYNVEFDKVHYPLPLLYEEQTDPSVLRTTVRRLRDEIKDLRRTFAKGDITAESLFDENVMLQTRIRDLKSELDVTNTSEINELKIENERLKTEIRTQKLEAGNAIRQLRNVNLRLQGELDHVKEEMDAVILQVEEEQQDRAKLPDTKTLLAMAQDYQRLQQKVTEQTDLANKYKTLWETQSTADSLCQIHRIKRSNSVPKPGHPKSALLTPSINSSKPVPRLPPPSPSQLESSISKLDRILKLMKS